MKVKRAADKTLDHSQCDVSTSSCRVANRALGSGTQRLSDAAPTGIAIVRSSQASHISEWMRRALLKISKGNRGVRYSLAEIVATLQSSNWGFKEAQAAD